MAFWLETKTEYWDALPVQYLRRTGAYGRENAALMAEMKKRITEQDYLKAHRKASREEEIARHGRPVGQSRVHRSKKAYDRKKTKAGV